MSSGVYSSLVHVSSILDEFLIGYLECTPCKNVMGRGSMVKCSTIRGHYSCIDFKFKPCQKTKFLAFVTNIITITYFYPNFSRILNQIPHQVQLKGTMLLPVIVILHHQTLFHLRVQHRKNH